MAQIDIGKIKPVFKGTYDNSTAYVLDDIVYYNGSSYVAKTSTTGNLPTDNTKWNLLASGSGGIYDSTLSIGSANQILAVNSGGTALEFQNASSGGLKQVKLTSTATSQTHSSSSWTDLTNVGLSITPSSASHKILVQIGIAHRFGQSNTGFMARVDRGGTIVFAETEQKATYINGSGTELQGRTPYMFLDTPNTTSAITYQVQVYTDGNSTVQFSPNYPSYISLMEVSV